MVNQAIFHPITSKFSWTSSSGHNGRFLLMSGVHIVFSQICLTFFVFLFLRNQLNVVLCADFISVSVH